LAWFSRRRRLPAETSLQKKADADADAGQDKASGMDADGFLAARGPLFDGCGVGYEAAKRNDAPFPYMDAQALD
jgi:hypothetical protein